MRKRVLFVYAAFFLSLVFLAVLSVSYYKRVLVFLAYSADIEHTHGVIGEINNLSGYLKDAETGQRGFLLTEDSAFLQPYLRFETAVRPSYEKLVTLTKGDTVQQRYLQQLNYTIARRMDYLDDALILFKSERQVLNRRLREGKKYMEQCERLLQNMREREERLLSARREQKVRSEMATAWYSSGTILFALIIFVVTFLLIIRELRQRRVYQRALEQKIVTLNQTNGELEQIAYVASHDLQEPLRKIRAFTDLLVIRHKSAVPAEGQHLIDRIQHSSTRMQGLVEDLVNFTSLVGTVEKPERVAIKDVIDRVRKMMLDTFEKHRVNLATDFQLPVITGYRQQLVLLFECLFDNAIKFARPGEPPSIFILTQQVTPDEMREKFHLRFGERYIKVIVRDNGVGFDNALASKMFGLFQRLHSPADGNSGKGIGLTMVKRIMINHSGYVTAWGKINEGSEFALYFPFPTGDYDRVER